jgi:methylglyoxal synthase
VLYRSGESRSEASVISDPLGGDLQIGARIEVGDVDAVIFLR